MDAMGGDEPALKRVPDLPAPSALDIQDEFSDTALKEAKLLGSDFDEKEIKSRQAAAEYKRNENFKNHFERITICGLWLVAAVALVLGTAWFWHVLSPESWHWLSVDQVSKIQNFMTGGIVAAVASGHVKKRLS